MPQAERMVPPVASYGGMTGNWTVISDKNFYKEAKLYCSKTFPGKEEALGLDEFNWEETKDGSVAAALNTSALLGIAIDQFCSDIKSDYRLATHKDHEKLYEGLFYQGMPVDGYEHMPVQFNGNHISPHSLVIYTRKDNNYRRSQPSASVLAMKGEPARIFEQLKNRSPEYARLVLDWDMKGSNTLEKPAMVSLRGLRMNKDLHIEFTDETLVGSVPDTFNIPKTFNAGGGDGVSVAFADSKTYHGHYDGHSFVGATKELVHNVYNIPLGDNIGQKYPNDVNLGPSFFVLVKPDSLDS